MARGKKICDKCGESNGVRTLKCKNCNTEFSFKQNKVDKTKESTPEQKEMIKSMPIVGLREAVKNTPKEHAERILSYGKERATMLYKLAQWSGYWKHVNWDIVKEGI